MRLLVLVLFLGILLAISLLTSKRRRRDIVIYTVIAICILIAVLIFPLLDLYSTEQLIEGYADNVASAFGVSPLLAKAAAFALLLPASLALTWVFSSNPLKRRRGSSILAAVAVFYFLALWVATKEQRVSRRGDPLQCYVVTEHGIVWRDIRYLGTDPETGRPCEPAKPYLLPTLARLDELLRLGRPLEVIDPKGRFFTSIGDPVVWYYRTKDGNFEFYNAPGFRPRSGEQLQPITKAVVDEWERREVERTEAEHRRLAALETAKLEAEAAVKRRQEEDRLAHMRSLVVAGTAGDVDQALGLAIVPSRANSALDRLAAERLPEVLARTVPGPVHVIPAMFTDGFFNEGYFTKAFTGDPTPLTESEALARAHRVALGQIETTCTPNSSIQGVTNCRVTLLLKAFGEGGRIVATEHLGETGPGFSEQDAVVRGVELLVEHSGARILQAAGR